MLQELDEMFARKAKGLCPMCRKPVNQEDFRDTQSEKEFRISGMCQECQDDFFGREW